MASKINITFYQRTNVVNHEEVAYIYCRVTIATKRSQFFYPRRIVISYTNELAASS